MVIGWPSELDLAALALSKPGHDISPSRTKTFHRFAELPFELRDEIWSLALLNQEPRLVELIVAANPESEDGVKKKGKRKISTHKAKVLADMRRSDAQVVPRCPNPALIEACAESRRVAINGYESAFNLKNSDRLSLSPPATSSLFNFETETLYITEEVINNTSFWDGPSWGTFWRGPDYGLGKNGGLMRNHEYVGNPDFNKVRSLAIRVPRDFDARRSIKRIIHILRQFPLVVKLTLALELDLEDEEIMKKVNFSSSCTDRQDLILLSPKFELPDLEFDFHLWHDISFWPAEECRDFIRRSSPDAWPIQRCWCMMHCIDYARAKRHHLVTSTPQEHTAVDLRRFSRDYKPMEVTLKVAVPRGVGEELKGSRKKQRLCRYKGSYETASPEYGPIAGYPYN